MLLKEHIQFFFLPAAPFYPLSVHTSRLCFQSFQDSSQSNFCSLFFLLFVVLSLFDWVQDLIG